jgi:hypothetical protein
MGGPRTLKRPIKITPKSKSWESKKWAEEVNLPIGRQGLGLGTS